MKPDRADCLWFCGRAKRDINLAPGSIGALAVRMKRAGRWFYAPEPTIGNPSLFPRWCTARCRDLNLPPLADVDQVGIGGPKVREPR